MQSVEVVQPRCGTTSAQVYEATESVGLTVRMMTSLWGLHISVEEWRLKGQNRHYHIIPDLVQTIVSFQWSSIALSHYQMLKYKQHMQLLKQEDEP